MGRVKLYFRQSKGKTRPASSLIQSRASLVPRVVPDIWPALWGCLFILPCFFSYYYYLQYFHYFARHPSYRVYSSMPIIALCSLKAPVLSPVVDITGRWSMFCLKHNQPSYPTRTVSLFSLLIKFLQQMKAPVRSHLSPRVFKKKLPRLFFVPVVLCLLLSFSFCKCNE